MNNLFSLPFALAAVCQEINTSGKISRLDLYGISAGLDLAVTFFPKTSAISIVKGAIGSSLEMERNIVG